MKRITDWFIDSHGSIRGSVIDSEDRFVTVITTSRVVKRDGNVVTTRSGSHYQLLEPSAIHMDRLFLDKFFDGAADALAAVDYRILNHD